MKKKWKVTWYDLSQIIQVDVEPVEGANKDEATANAYIRYNGNPPAPCCLLEPLD